MSPSESGERPLQYSQGAKDRIRELRDRFEVSLEEISGSLCLYGRKAKGDRVAPAHVDDAFKTIMRYGVTQPPWWKRWEFVSASGGIVGTLAFQVKHALEFVGLAEPALVIGATAACAAIGAVLTGMGLLGHKFT